MNAGRSIKRNLQTQVPICSTVACIYASAYLSTFAKRAQGPGGDLIIADTWCSPFSPRAQHWVMPRCTGSLPSALLRMFVSHRSSKHFFPFFSRAATPLKLCTGKMSSLPFTALKSLQQSVQRHSKCPPTTPESTMFIKTLQKPFQNNVTALNIRHINYRQCRSV